MVIREINIRVRYRDDMNDVQATKEQGNTDCSWKSTTRDEIDQCKCDLHLRPSEIKPNREVSL